MKKTFCLSVIATAASIFASAPEVSVTKTEQDLSRLVTVNYTLSGEPGIITPVVQTNRGDGVWIDIGDENLTHFAGDVNRIVDVGDRSFTWQPEKAWPNHKIKDNAFRIGAKVWATNAPPDIMVVSLVTSNCVWYYSSAAALAGGVTNDLYKTELLVMRRCPAANVTWRMGSPTTEIGRDANNETAHEVALTKDYYIGVYAVTQKQYEYMMNARPSGHKLESDYPTRPVESVSYEDLRGTAGGGYDWPDDKHAVKPDGFIGKLRGHSGIMGFDLPTEAQWEFACRAGCGDALYNGKNLTEANKYSNCSDLNPLGRYAWNGGLKNGSTYYASATIGATNAVAKVGSYNKPNAWGLYDMLGNVGEWCLDWYNPSYQDYDAETGPKEGTNRSYRGGSFDASPNNTRCATRKSKAASFKNINLGFRLACGIGAQ